MPSPPSPRDAWERLRELPLEARERLAPVRYLLEDVAYAAGRASVRIRDAVADSWLRASPAVRVLGGTVLALAALAALVWLVLIPIAPCGAPGGDRCPPDDDAIALVPADVDAYLHVNVDPATEQMARAEAFAELLPSLSDEVIALAREALPIGGGKRAFERGVSPWFGGEVALATPPGAGSEEPLLLLEASDEEGAREFARRLAGARDAPAGEYRGIEVYGEGTGVLSAVASGFLFAGPERALHAGLDVASGEAPALSEAPAAEAAIGSLPDHRLGEVYLSAGGASEWLGAGSLAELLDSLVDLDATQGVAAALVVSADGVEVAIESVFDPGRPRTSPAPLGAGAGFEPDLVRDVGAGALAYLGIGDPSGGAAALARATLIAPGLLGDLERVARRLGRQGRVDLERDVLATLDGEVALFVEPGREGELAPGVVPPAGAPHLTLVAGGVQVEAARRALARLEAPLAAALEPGRGGRGAAFEERDLGGIEARSLRLSRSVDLTYALSGDRLVVSTDPAGVEAVLAGEGGLAEARPFERATAGFPDRLSFLAYLDLAELIGLAELVGLAENPAYQLLAPDARRLGALGLEVNGGEDRLSTRARVVLRPQD